MKPFRKMRTVQMECEGYMVRKRKNRPIVARAKRKLFATARKQKKNKEENV